MKEQKSCRQCQQLFLIEEEDIAFYQKVSPIFHGNVFTIPPPKLCPTCREQHRLTWRNEHKLYNRKCDLTGQDVISMHAPDKKYPVYSSEAWWGGWVECFSIW